ncbi:hypothetical protein A5893_04245 [Pedobacter psychrophilus]|uniref:GLPGLI family protein n=1 Tax=Pedobacter psychrophilus TaxID=1826909 RepID=A0A179DMQ2_9SPHI|nr:GLPGLI family protein [Pedobacter psychrophilus]OAQ42327.1 hypothetical protein A5893_04245 [Pedobacter psychrophilus]
MKKIYLLLVCLIGLKCFAQQPDIALLRANYNYVHIIDTNFKEQPRKEEMLLVIGKNASIYTSFDKINRDIAMKKQVEEQMKNQEGSNNMKINVSSLGYRPTTNVDYFTFASEGKFFVKERLINNYLIEEPIPVFNWSIEKDTMSIGGFLCQKATANFKGRNWIAWFASDLPFSTGPWKLNGLPGLILEAYDDKKEVQFLFNNLEKVIAALKEKEETDLKNKVMIMGSDKFDYMGSDISLPKEGIKTSRKDFEKLKQAQKDDPQGFAKTQMAAMGMSGDIRISSVSNSKTGGAKVPVMNNPIELPAIN